MARPVDAAAEALLLPLREARLVWPGKALFLEARPSTHWPAAWCGQTVAVQPFAPQAECLRQHGFRYATQLHDDETAPLVLLLPPRQRDLARALMVLALERCQPGGHVVVAARNDEGAASTEADLRALAAQVEVKTKYHCRVLVASGGIADRDAARLWKTRGLPRQRGDGLWTQVGVFSEDGVDPASELLMSQLPLGLRGDVADFGAGIGVLARRVGQASVGVQSLALYEADQRALDLARRNLADFRVPVRFEWADVTAGVDRQFDVIVMNPPFHAQARRGDPDLGIAFIETAANSLRREGALWMVANTHLPYEAVLLKRFASVRTLAQAGGFKVIHASARRTAPVR